MKTLHDLNNIPEIFKPVLTVGTFDGVHVGHQKILRRLVEEAKIIGGSSVLLTFYPHPRLVLNSDNEIKLITTLQEKQEMLSDIGLDYLIVLPFSKSFASQSPSDYVKNVLVDSIGISKIIIGHDHKFGKDRKGDITLLKLFSKQYHYQVEEILAIEIDDINVSSSKIRKAILSGNIQIANQYLAKPFELTGIVGKGKQLGRTIGFPTANLLAIDNHKIIPKIGVYAGYAILDGFSYKGMINIGCNPTVDNPTPDLKIEIHILDFNHDIYNRVISFDFVSYLRDEIKFESIESLKNQLLLDEKKTRALLHH